MFVFLCRIRARFTCQQSQLTLLETDGKETHHVLHLDIIRGHYTGVQFTGPGHSGTHKTELINGWHAPLRHTWSCWKVEVVPYCWLKDKLNEQQWFIHRVSLSWVWPLRLYRSYCPTTRRYPLEYKTRLFVEIMFGKVCFYYIWRLNRCYSYIRSFLSEGTVYYRECCILGCLYPWCCYANEFLPVCS